MKNLKHALVMIALTLFSAMALAQKTTLTFIHTDHLGSPIMATNADGSVKWREDYQPFGKQLTQQDTDNNIGYTGHLDDKSLGLTYMQARWYNADVGRFMAVDPIRYRDIHSFNRYVYANNNPYKYVDPDGRETNPVGSTSGIYDDQLRTNSFNPNVGKWGYTRSENNWNKGYHNGVDIKAPRGSGLVAPISGKVITISERDNPKGGNVIFISRTEGDVTTTIGLAHLDSIEVENGSIVHEGDFIGYAGTTGNADGIPQNEEHVHMSVKVNGEIVDPQKHFSENPSRLKD